MKKFDTMPPELLAAMRRIRATERIPITAQVEFALRDWLQARGAIVKAERKRAVTRRRS